MRRRYDRRRRILRKGGMEMTVREVLDIVMNLTPSKYGEDTLRRWLKIVEGTIFHDVVLTHEGACCVPEPTCEDCDTLIVPDTMAEDVYINYLQRRTRRTRSTTRRQGASTRRMTVSQSGTTSTTDRSLAARRGNTEEGCRMKIPKVQAYDGSLQVVDTFGGLNRAEKIREGEWNETLNLSSDNYPLLSTRKKRTLLGTRTRDIYDMIVKGNTIYTVEEDDSTYYLCGGTQDVELPSESKGLVSMGAYIIVLGANIWYNTADGTHGDINAATESPSEDITASGMTYSYVLKLCPCESDGTELRIVEEIPENQQEAWEESTSFAHDGECFAVGTKRLIRQRHGDNSSMWWETTASTWAT